MAKLIYGLKDNKILHIDKANQGLECGCICPNCGSKLIAKQGKINEHHFAHEIKECDIAVAQETALHYLAKEILSESKIIKLPKVIIEDSYAFHDKRTYNDIFFNSRYIVSKHNLFHKIEKYQDSTRKIDNVIIEKYLVNIKPDILLEIDNKKLIIEIAVTHFIDQVKKQKIFGLQIPTIEINLSSYKDKINEIDKETLTKILLNETQHKKWIYYQNILEDIEEVKAKNNNIILKILNVNEYWKNNFNKEYRSCYENYCEDDRNKYIGDFWQKQWLSQKMPMPWFVNYPINGDILYNGDRKRWQSMIINKIYFSKNKLSIDELVTYITGQDFLKVFDNSRFTILKFGERQELLMSKTNRYQVIRDYCKFLQEQNVIDINCKWIQSS